MTALSNLIRSWPDAMETAYTPSDITEDFVHLLAALRDARASLATFADRVERDLLAVMGERSITVEGVGLVEAKKSVRRTKWDHDSLVASIVSRLADEPDVFFDPEDGVLLPHARIGHNVARRMRECISFGAGKVTGMRAIGLSPDEFCEEDESHWSVKLPSRSL